MILSIAKAYYKLLNSNIIKYIKTDERYGKLYTEDMFLSIFFYFLRTEMITQPFAIVNKFLSVIPSGHKQKRWLTFCMALCYIFTQG